MAFCPTEIRNRQTLDQIRSSALTGRQLTASAMAWPTVVPFPTETRDLSILRNVQTGSEVPPASCPVGTRCILRGKAAESSSWPLTHPSGAEIKNEWSYRSTPSIHLFGGIKSALPFLCATKDKTCKIIARGNVTSCWPTKVVFGGE